ncbi:pilus assembly protein PilP [Ferrimonas pelagia]|uniref:Type 4a pilus biogenesis lipoprotein PilP n=1 Tax=Ferrimonas pelagia TaxID=1177826 RepID=A0ABP9FGB2_9GAMM
MMRRYALLFSVMLAGCGGGMADLRQYVAEVQATPVPFTEAAPPALEIVGVPYLASSLRSPFRYQKVSLSEQEQTPAQDCPRPDLTRTKGALEAYAIDSFALKGILQDAQKKWALLQSGDGAIHTVGVGDFLGLYHGQVKAIGATGLVVAEWIPDAKGCWHSRETQLAMVIE